MGRRFSSLAVGEAEAEHVIVMPFTRLKPPTLRIEEIDSRFEKGVWCPHDKGRVFLGRGRHRRVYFKDASRYVIKIPWNWDGLAANEKEDRTFRRWGYKPDPDGIRYARCRLLSCGCLVMEKVREVLGEEMEELPEWSYYIDCQQVGYSHRSGEMVAFDWAP